MKRMFCFLIVSFLCTQAQGQRSQTISFSFSESSFSLIADTLGLVSIVPSEKGYTLKPDSLLPAIPYLCVNVLIGRGETFEGMSVSEQEHLCAEGVELSFNPKLINTGDFESQTSFCVRSTMPNSYPTETVEYCGLHVVDSYRFLSFQVSPFRYDGGSKCLYLKDSVSLSINLGAMPVVPATDGNGFNMREVLSGFVVNTADIDSLYGPTLSAFSDETMSQIKYLIVTNETLKPVFQRLADWKTTKGVKAKVITVEEIYASYTGISDQLKIKMAISDYYNGRYTGLSYVLLGGDDDVVPVMNCIMSCGGKTESIPTDLYYSCFDTMDWDANGNQIFGEIADGVDVTPDVSCTRASVSTVGQANVFVDKIITYEKEPDTEGWEEKILMGGSTVGDVVGNTERMAELLYSDYVYPLWDGDYTYFYDTKSQYSDGTQVSFTKEKFIDELSRGYTFVNIDCHGNVPYWSFIKDDFIYNRFDALEHVNNGYSVILSSSCYVNGFDSETSLSENFLRSPTSGAVGFFGCSRYGWLSSGLSNTLEYSALYNAMVIKNILSKKHHRFGEAVAATKAMLSDKQTNSYYRWLQFGTNPLGDPETPVYVNKPKVMHFPELSFMGNEMIVSSVPDSSLVCVMGLNGNDYYQIKTVRNNNTFVATPSLSSVCVCADGYIPFLLTSYCQDAIQNEIFNGNNVVNASNVVVGSDVTTDKPQGGVVVFDGETIIKGSNSVTIKNDFEVRKGALLTIN